MTGWNPFGKIDIEIGSFMKDSQFNKIYAFEEKDEKVDMSVEEYDVDHQ